ncbi:MAG: hypothetical protein WDZ47_12840 [Bacteroidales bacterium]
MTTKNEKEKKNEPGFWDDTKENINEGAKIVGDEARDLGEKISSYSEEIFGKIKEHTSEVFQSGKELTRDAVNKAQEMAEKYRDQTEVRKLNEEKKKVAAQLGMSFYLILKNNDNKVPDTLLRRKAIKTTLKEMEELDQQILELSEDKE